MSGALRKKRDPGSGPGGRLRLRSTRLSTSEHAAGLSRPILPTDHARRRPALAPPREAVLGFFPVEGGGAGGGEVAQAVHRVDVDDAQQPIVDHPHRRAGHAAMRADNKVGNAQSEAVAADVIGCAMRQDQFALRIAGPCRAMLGAEGAPARARRGECWRLGAQLDRHPAAMARAVEGVGGGAGHCLVHHPEFNSPGLHAPVTLAIARFRIKSGMTPVYSSLRAARGGVAIQGGARYALDCFATLAMTRGERGGSVRRRARPLSQPAWGRNCLRQFLKRPGDVSPQAPLKGRWLFELCDGGEAWRHLNLVRFTRRNRDISVHTTKIETATSSTQ